MRKSFLLSFGSTLIVSVLFLGHSLFAVETKVATSAIDVGNNRCPVSGDKISGKDFVEYQGKKYALCCPMCAKDFKKDPQRYIAKLSSQNETPEEGAAVVTQATGGVSEEEAAVSKAALPPPPDQVVSPIAAQGAADQKAADGIVKVNGETVAKTAGGESKKTEVKKEEKHLPQMYYN